MSRTWTDSAIRWLINKCKTTFLPKNQFYDGYLGWGGRNIAGDVSPIDAAMSSLHNPNRAEMCKAEGITVEYSSDGGSTWNDYGLSDDAKRRLLSVNGSVVYYVPGGAKNRSTDVQLRITLNATKMGIYTLLKKVLINFSTQGTSGTTVLVERSFKGSESNWKPFGTYPVTGWSGWNSLYLPGAFGGGDGQTGNVANIRFTFRLTALPTNDSYFGNPCVLNILLFGTTAWLYNSNLANTGHLYSWDMAGNATFPARVSAGSFNGYTIKANVPADAKFTDTTYAPATSSANGLMSASDKKKLDGIAEGANKYTHPSHTARANGLYKMTVDALGHVTNADAVTKSDITALGIPDTNTTYSAATSSAAGLMTAADKKKLDGFANADQYAKAADVAGKPRAFQNVTVPVSLWETGSAVGSVGREYLANVPLSGVTQDMYPQVVFDPSEDGLYNFSPTCMTYDGGVQIYAETMPTDAITLLSVICFSV